MQAAIPARLCVETEVVPFSEAEQAWNRNSGKRRLVFVPREMKIRIGN
jgi:hypothetical protein